MTILEDPHNEPLLQQITPVLPEDNQFFIGREALLQQLHEILQPGKRVVLTGMPGVGKTQIASRYAHKHHSDYRTILYTLAGSPTTLSAGFAAIAQHLNLLQKDEQDRNRVVESVKQWLKTNPGWLLIFDNADDLPIISGFLPSGRRGAVLITTRASAIDVKAYLRTHVHSATGRNRTSCRDHIRKFLHIHPNVQCVEIPAMSEEEGVRLLLRRANRLAESITCPEVSDDRRYAAVEIHRKLDGLPLALDLAGAYIADTQITPTDYLTLLRHCKADLLAEHDKNPLGYFDAVMDTFMLTLQHLEAEDTSTVNLLRCCALLAPDAIPEEIFTEGASELGDRLGPVAADKTQWNSLLKTIMRLSLLHRAPASRMLTIHRLVQEALKLKMDDDIQHVWAERVVRAVNCAFPEAEFARPSEWLVYDRLLLQARACTELIQQWNFVFPEAGRLLNELGVYSGIRAQFDQGESFHLQAHALRDNMMEPRATDLAETLHNLAHLYLIQHQYSKAEKFSQRALAVIEKAHGPEHPSIGSILNGLASAYFSQRQYIKIEPLLRRALKIQQLTLGVEHKEVAETLFNLATLYNVLSRDAEAEQLLRRALAILEKALAPDHPWVAKCLDKLAMLCVSQFRFAEAEQHLRRALAILEHVLGPDDPNLVAILENYSVLLLITLRWRQAREIKGRAKEIRKSHGNQRLHEWEQAWSTKDRKNTII